MQIEITDQLSNGLIRAAQSADGRYTWFCGQDGYIQDTVADRSIYQMAYMRKTEFGSDPLPNDVAADVHAFWAALNPLVEAGREAEETARINREVREIEARERLYDYMDSQMAPEDR